MFRPLFRCQGKNPSNFSGQILENFRGQKFILKFTDLYPLIQPGSIWLVGQKLFKRCSVEGKGGPEEERFYKETSQYSKFEFSLPKTES